MFDDPVLTLLLLEEKETGGGGIMLLLNIVSECDPADIDGELIGETSFGDNESMLSTPLSASDIAVGTLGVCGAVEKELFEARMELDEEIGVVGYGGGGRSNEDVPDCGRDETIKPISF